MIESSPNKPSQPSSTSNAVHSEVTSASFPPPEYSSNKKKTMCLIFVLLFVLAIGAGIIAFQAFVGNRANLTSTQTTLAWTPTISGTCAGGTIKMNQESEPFNVKLDLSLNGAPPQTKLFVSQGPTNS